MIISENISSMLTISFCDYHATVSTLHLLRTTKTLFATTLIAYFLHCKLQFEATKMLSLCDYKMPAYFFILLAISFSVLRFLFLGAKIKVSF